MKNFFGGLVFGVALGAAGLYGVQTFVWSPASDCEDSGQAPAAAVEPEAEQAEPEAPTRAKRKRRGKPRAGDEASDSDEARGGPALDQDGAVPRFDPNKDQAIGAADGSERLSDAVIDRELAKLDTQFQGCIRDANERVDELGTGRVKYGFGVAGSGKVTGVNASAPANLLAGGIVPCVRKVVYGHRFPAFNGPEMAVSSSFSVL